MKTFFLLTSLLLISFIGCSQNQQTDSGGDSTAIDSLALATVTLHVEGMTCEGCEMTVSTSLEKLAGVQKASASHIDSTAVVVFDTSQISQTVIAQKIVELGYSVIDETENN